MSPWVVSLLYRASDLIVVEAKTILTVRCATWTAGFGKLEFVRGQPGQCQV